MMDELSKFNIINIHTDNFKAYKSVIKNNYNLTTTKDQTTQIESFNSVIRSFLSRFNRRTKSYTKSLRSLELTLLTFFNFYNKKNEKYLDNQFINYIFAQKSFQGGNLN